MRFTFLLPSLVLTLALFSNVAHSWEAPAYPEAKLLAVEVWAEWCPNCRILDPELQRARMGDALDDLPVLFVKLNYTDKTTINQAKMQGKALGLEEFMKANGAGTGYVALLDPANKKELARFTKDSKAIDITKTIKEKLAAH
jgi:thiol-disulfide isomerase/thioredoxin